MQFQPLLLFFFFFFFLLFFFLSFIILLFIGQKLSHCDTCLPGSSQVINALSPHFKCSNSNKICAVNRKLMQSQGR